jgi:hypothetical protein
MNILKKLSKHIVLNIVISLAVVSLGHAFFYYFG